MTQQTPEEVLDLLCLGFGPASLALAIALAEPLSLGPNSQAEYSAIGGLQDALRASAVRPTAPVELPAPNGRTLRVGFVEKQREFTWHGGMLLPGSKMQISFLKDLVTMRNPSSTYSFLAYLHSSAPSRLVSFISRSTFTPSRIEYADYMKWAALKVAAELERGTDGAQGEVSYGEEVLSIVPDQPSHTNRTDHSSSSGLQQTSNYNQEDVQVLIVTSRTSDGRTRSRRTRNVVISAGGSPRLPTSLAAPEIASSSSSGRIMHSSEFLRAVPPALDEMLSQLRKEKPIRIGVLGGGQSAAETFLAVREQLATRLARLANEGHSFARPQVELIIKKGSLHAAEDASFGNEVFDPGMSQAVFGLDDSSRRKVMSEAKGTNYSVVNPTTLEGMYEIMYEQKVEEEAQDRTESALELDPKLSIRALTNVVDAHPAGGDGVVLTLENVLTGARSEDEFDLVICGTGYDRAQWKRWLFPPAGSSNAGLSDTFARRPVSPGLDVEDDPLGLDRATERLSATRLEPRREPRPARSNSTLATSAASSAGDSCTSSRSSAPSTPLTSPSPSSSRSRAPKPQAEEYKVAVNYRLQLPALTREGAKFRPTVWLQGANEDSHGISDSLLSVLAIRSGEVARGIRSEGWFGGEEA